MSTEKKIKPWRPIENLADSFHIYSIYNDYDGFRVILTEYNDETKKVLIEFPGVSVYRITKKPLAMHILDGYDTEPFENEEFRLLSLFTLTNSEYLKWASDQSDTLSEALRLVHYCIWTKDEVFEVLSWVAPKVEFIDVPETIKNRKVKDER